MLLCDVCPMCTFWICPWYLDCYHSQKCLPNLFLKLEHKCSLAVFLYFFSASWEFSAGAEQEKRFSLFFQRVELECHPLALWEEGMVEMLSLKDMSSRLAFADNSRKSSWVLPLTKGLVLRPSVSCLQTQSIRDIWRIVCRVQHYFYLKETNTYQGPPCCRKRYPASICAAYGDFQKLLACSTACLEVSGT